MTTPTSMWSSTRAQPLAELLRFHLGHAAPAASLKASSRARRSSSSAFSARRHAPEESHHAP